LPRRRKAKLDRVPLQLVNPKVRLPFRRALGHGVVDGFGLLGRVDVKFGLEIDAAAEGDGRLPVLGDAPASLDRFLGHRQPVRFAGPHGPLALEEGQLFPTGLFRAGGTHENEQSDHENEPTHKNPSKVSGPNYRAPATSTAPGRAAVLSNRKVFPRRKAAEYTARLATMPARVERFGGGLGRCSLSGFMGHFRITWYPRPQGAERVPATAAPPADSGAHASARSFAARRALPDRSLQHGVPAYGAPEHGAGPTLPAACRAAARLRAASAAAGGRADRRLRNPP